MYDRKKSEKSRSNRSFAFSGQPFLAALPGRGKVTVSEGWSRNVKVPQGEHVTKSRRERCNFVHHTNTTGNNRFVNVSLLEMIKTNQL